MTLFMAKIRPKWQGCSRLDRPTWKVSCAPYHTPIHGPFLPFPGTCQGLAGFLCLTVIYDLSMLIYGAEVFFQLSVKGQSLGSYQVCNSPAHPDPLRWWKMVLEDEKMNLEVSFSVIDQFCSQDLLYLYHSITRFLWFDMMTAYILVSSRYLRRLPFQLSCQRLHPPPNTMLRPPQFPTLLPHCPCQPPSHL